MAVWSAVGAFLGLTAVAGFRTSGFRALRDGTSPVTPGVTFDELAGMADVCCGAGDQIQRNVGIVVLWLLTDADCNSCVARETPLWRQLAADCGESGRLSFHVLTTPQTVETVSKFATRYHFPGNVVTALGADRVAGGLRQGALLLDSSGTVIQVVKRERGGASPALQVRERALSLGLCREDPS